MNTDIAVAGRSAQAPNKLTVEMIDEIVKIHDTTVRNLRVTLGYYDLSRRIARVLGYENANWCSVAVWASRVAGEYIRGEIPLFDSVFRHLQMDANPDQRIILDAVKKRAANPLPGVPAVDDQVLANLASRFRANWLRQIESKNYEGPAGLGTLFALVLGASAQATTLGNTTVFEDVAKAFVPFFDLLEKSKSADDKDLSLYLRRMSSYPARLGGQLEMRLALRHYALAKFEKDPAQRSRLMLVANGFVGCHEQTRLQEVIPLALESPIDMLSAEIVKYWSALLWPKAPGSLRHKLASTRVGWMMDRLVRRSVIPAAAAVAGVLWGTFATKWMMSLRLPDETLDLGNDLPPLPDGSAFPACLDVAVLEKAGLGSFVHFLSQAYDDTLRGTSASDWTSYMQRMNTVFNLFRSRQMRQSLFRPPFTEAQIEVLRHSRFPTIPLGPLGGEIPPFTAEGLRELRSYRAP